MDGINFKAIAVRGLEFMLFITALFFAVPQTEAVINYPNEFMPAGAFAITAFSFSRVIGWRRTKDNPFPYLLEMAAFAVFARLSYGGFAALV